MSRLAVFHRIDSYAAVVAAFYLLTTLFLLLSYNDPAMSELRDFGSIYAAQTLRSVSNAASAVRYVRQRASSDLHKGIAAAGVSFAMPGAASAYAFYDVFSDHGSGDPPLAPRGLFLMAARK